MRYLPVWLRTMGKILLREANKRGPSSPLFVVLRSLAIDCQAAAAEVELEDEDNAFAEADTLPGRNATRVGVAPGKP